MENSANSTAYNTAFPSFKDNMGCEESKATPADRECIGYELKANLNFNTNSSATSSTNPTGADSGDTYWNSGLGWDPIGGTAGAQYTALFDGNGDSDSDGGPYVISNLFIDRTSGRYAGLFAYLNGADASDEVTDMALENVDITLNVDATDFVYVGALAGKAETNIISSYSTGEVNSATKITAANKYLFIGGLVGQLRDAGITASYSWADVTGNTSSSTHTNRTYSGGLVGLVGQLESASPPTTKIIASYAAGDVSATPGGGGHARAGGLTGQVGYGGSIDASYARGNVHGGASEVNNQRGALAGYQFGNITASFATGKLTGDGGNRCGLVGYKNSGSITNSYYDSSNLGQTGCNSNNGTPKTTSELQTPTAYGTGSSIYANWNLNIDGNTGNDDPWDFGDANQYPALKYGGHTPADQRPTVDITASPTTIYEAVGGATSSTVTATLSTDWNKDVAVTIPAATDGLTVTNSPLSFTSGASGNWGTAQTATVALAADPGSGKTVVVDFTRLDVNDPEVTPKYLKFTGGTNGTWNTPQTVSLKFLAEPTADTTRVAIQGTGNSKTYKVNLNAYRLPYDLGNPAVIVAEGATTGTETLTAQNDYNDLANATATLSLATHPTDDDWISKGTGTAPSLTITDDDELGQVTNVSVVQKTGTAGNLAGGATVTWTKVTNATGYVIEWKSGAQIYDSSRRLVAGDVATYDVPASNLTPGTAYDIRVYATKSNSDHGLPSNEISFTYTGWLVFDKTQVNITELVTGTQTGTYTVALSVAPSSNVTVNLSYRVPQMTLDPSTITFNSTNWNQWQPFTVEADQFPPRGTGRNDWTNVTFNDTSELDFRIPQRDTSTQGFIRHEKITFLVKLKANPNTDKVVDLTSMYSVSVPSTHRITASPATLTFTTVNWSTPQTVTLSAPSDTHGIDEEETFVHTTVSTDLAYSGVKSMVSAKQIDSNSPPTSANFTRYIQTGRTMVNPGEPYFSFTDSDANDTKYAIIIESLPAAAQGALKRYRARQTGGRCRIFPNRPECGVIEENVYVGQILPTEDSKSSTAILLYFFPANGFSGASFTYRMVDNTGNISDAAYTVTLSPVGNVPAKPSGFTATPRNTKAQLSWTDPKDTTITKYEYSVINITDGGQWSNWTAIPCTSECVPANLTSYTATNLTNKKKYQFRIQAVSLNGNSPPSEPRGVAPDILPAPSSLAATGDTADIDLTWDNPNNPYVTGYQIRQQEDNGSFTTWTDISGSSASTTAHSVTGIASGKFYSFQIRAVDDVGPGTASASVKSALLPAKPTGLTATPGDTNVTLAWTDPANPTIDMWQYQEGSNPWKDATIGVTFGSSTLTFTPSILATLGSSILTFTSQNWNVYQTVTVKLASQPPTGATTVTFNVPGAEFSPASLSFTEVNWNTNQNVQVKLTAAPQQDTDVSLTHPRHLVTSPQKWNVYQTVTVQLAAAPAATLDVAFNAPNLDFSPASLRFTPQNWNQNQSLRVKLNTPPLANTNVDMTSVYSVPWDGSTSYLVTGLVNTTNFTFKIRAVNIGGIGPASDGAATAPTNAPAQPTGFTVTPGVAQATLNWTASNDSAITAYEYRHTKPAGGLTAFPNDKSVDLTWNSPSDTSDIAKWQYRANANHAYTDIPNSGPTTTSYTVDGLSNGTSYTFQVRAATASATAGGLTASGDYTRVHLFWSKPSDTSSSIHTWQYRYKSGGSYGPWTVACQAVGGPQQIAECKNRISLTVSALTHGTSYTFQVRALTSSGTPVGTVLGEVTMTPLAAAKPLGPVSVTPTSSGGWTAIPGSGATTITHTVTSLTNETLYAFQIRARRNNAIGPHTGNPTATPAALPLKPTNLTATSGENEAVTLKWPTSNTANSWQYTTDDGTNWTTITTPIARVGGNHVYRVPGLTNGTAYTFKIRGRNRNDAEGPASDAATATPRLLPKPTGLTAVAADSSFTVTWTNPNDAAIIRYEYQVTPKGEEPVATKWFDVPVSTASTTSHTVTQLTNNTAYDYHLRAVTPVQKSAAAEVTATPVAAPDAPANLTAAIGDQQVTLTWDDPKDSSITEYQYRTDGTNWTSIPNSRATTVTHTVTDLTNGTEYTFNVRAVSLYGNGASSQIKATPYLLPAAPTGLAARPGDKYVDLSWNWLQGQSLPWYEYQKRTKTGQTWDPWGDTWTFVVPRLDSGKLRAEVSGLTNYTEYQFRVRAFNVGGPGSPSAPVSATPGAIPPPQPTNFAVTPGQGKMSLSWTNPAGIPLTGNSYRYRPKSTTDNGWTDWTSIPLATSREVTGLTAGVLYTFRVRAHNASGASWPSYAAWAWTYPAAPRNLTATPGDRTVSLTWDYPYNSSITRYEYQQKTGGAWSNTWTQISSSDSDTTQYVAGSLINGTTYTFRVRAVGSGNGAISSEVTATPQPAPAMPTSVTGTAKDASYATFTWSHPDATLIQKFQTRYRRGSAAWTSWTDAPKTKTSYSLYEVASVSNLDQATYTLPMLFNPSRSWAQEFTTGDATGGYTLSSLTIDFEAVNNASDVVVAIHSKSNGNVGASIGATLSGTPAAGQVVFTCTGTCTLTADTSYYIKVSATGQGSGSLNNTASGSETPIPSDNGWSIAHRAVVEESGFGPGSSSNTANAMKLKLDADKTGVSGIMAYGTVYTFEVRAVNSSNQNSPAAQASAATAPAKPTSLTATGAFREALLDWDNPHYPSITSWRYQQAQPVNGLAAFSGGDSVDLAWNTPSSTTNISKWQYRYKPASNSDNGFTGWTGVPGSNASTAFATVGRVRTGTPTFFQVRAVNSSNVLVGTVLGDAPAAHWPTPWTAISSSDASTTSHTVASLTAGTAYAFRNSGRQPGRRGSAFRRGIGDATRPASPRTHQPRGVARRHLGHHGVDQGQSRPLHHPLRVPLQDRRRLPRHLDGHTRQQLGHHLLQSHRPDQRHRPHLPVARRQLLRRRPRRHRQPRYPHRCPVRAPRPRQPHRRPRRPAGHPVMDRPQRFIHHRLPVQHRRHKLDDHPQQQRIHHHPHRHQPHQRHVLHLLATGGELHRQRLCGGSGSHALGSPRQAHRLHRHTRQPAGHPRMDRPLRLLHHKLAVQEGQRRVDEYPQQHRDHHHLHRHKPDQRHVLRLPHPRPQLLRQQRPVQ